MLAVDGIPALNISIFIFCHECSVDRTQSKSSHEYRETKILQCHVSAEYLR
jgi:hypothetical protein